MSAPSHLLSTHKERELRAKHEREIAAAFRARRVSTRGDLTCTGDTVSVSSNIIATRNPDGSIWTILFGLPHRSVAPLNAICEVYGFGRPYRVTDNEWFFDDVEESTMAWRQLIGPLAVLAIEAERNQSTT